MAIPFLSWSTNPDGNRVASEAIQRAGAPTTSTVGMLGQNYINTSSSPRDVYTCVNIANGVYTWILNGQVTGIKGNSESTYRTGNVNITADNIGLGNVNNTADSVKNVLSATKLATARTINVSNGARGTAVSFNGENNISIPIDSVYASYLSWGGKGLTGIVAPVDIAMNNEFNANRLAFMTASDIVIEYSNDGGTTWTNYDTSDSGKIGLVTTSFSYGIGGRSSGNTSNDLLRITLTAREGILYSSLKEIQLQISTNGASGSNVTLEGRTVGNYNDNLDVWSIFVSKQAVAGWSGWNVLNYPFTFGGSSTQTYQHRQMRMTFGINAPSSSGKGLQVLALRAYGENLWSGTNSYQRTGHMYSFDTSQNVIFPARVAAPTFSGDLSGTATKATQDASGNIITSTYAPLVSPVFVGVPTVPTASSEANNAQIANTAFVQAALPTTLPASDVYSWAKASTKPTYTASEIGLGNVNNTSDLNKPVSTATQTALNLKANIASPALTGTPTAPTAAIGTSTTQIATTEFVADAVGKIRGTSTVICTITPALADVTVTLTSGTNIYSGVSNASGIATINVISAIGLNYAVTFSNPDVSDVSMTDPNVQIDYYGVYNISAKYFPPVTYTVIIDETNSNSLTCCAYADDATGMTKGSSDWDTKPIFNKIKPCVFQNGSVNYYLNPNNYAQKADGSASVLTGGDGDVMVEFAKFAYRIYRSGNYLYVSISNDPTVIAADSRFTYNAFSRNSLGDRNYMYVGAYHGHTISSKLRSVSGQLPTINQTINTFRTQAQANGTGYQQFTFYQLTALQCLYLIKYGNLNSQSALGRGYVNGSEPKASGDTNANGMYYGTTSSTQSVKFAGIEDFWGNVFDWIDGLYSDSSWHILTNYGNYNNTGSGYTDNGQGATGNVTGYITNTQGINSNTGFIIKVGGGSSSTYYADNGFLNSNRLAYFGGHCYGGPTAGSVAGAFRLEVDGYVSGYGSTISARLSYI